MSSNRITSSFKAASVIAAGALAGSAGLVGFTALADRSEAAAPTVATTLDRSGTPRVGKASFYAARYAGRAMADGTPMSLYSNNAASRTLPLGSTAGSPISIRA